MRPHSLQKAELWSLLAVIAFLPAIEAPKNIALVLYLIFWATNRYQSGYWGGRWAAWDSLVLALTLTAYASAAFGAFVPGKGLAAANDVLTYSLLFTAVRRSSYEPDYLWRLLGVLLLSTMLTLAYGYWGLLVTGERQTLGLHSVGHVNHSAIYLAIVFSAALAWTSNSFDKTLKSYLLTATTAILGISLFVTQARGALIPTFLFVALWLVLRAKSRRSALAYLATLLIAVTSAAILTPGIRDKTKIGLESGQIASYRPALARTALLAAREYPVFGVGVTNFGKINEELTTQWQTKHFQWFSPDELYFASHAHSLYFNTLAERGLLGLLPLIALLVSFGTVLVRQRPRGLPSKLEGTLWGGAFGAWVITVVGGLFNTTLHHEHALVTVCLIGLWLGHKTSLRETAS